MISNAESSAALLSNQVFAPYGTPLSHNGNDISQYTNKGFTGQYTDPTSGLDYYVSRYYDSVSGIFLSADKTLGDATGMNPYNYVCNNPETYNDPTGQAYIPPGNGSGGTGGNNNNNNNNGGGWEWWNPWCWFGCNTAYADTLPHGIGGDASELQGTASDISIDATINDDLNALQTQTTQDADYTQLTEDLPQLLNDPGDVLQGDVDMNLDIAEVKVADGQEFENDLKAEDTTKPVTPDTTTSPDTNTDTNNTESNTTKVYRVQGGTTRAGAPGSQYRLNVTDNGNIQINGSQMLHMNFGDQDRAQWWLNNRGPESQLVSFDISNDFVAALRELAVPQSVARDFPGFPQIDDPAVVDEFGRPTQFGLPSDIFGWLLESAVPGSAVITSYFDPIP